MERTRDFWERNVAEVFASGNCPKEYAWVPPHPALPTISPLIRHKIKELKY